MFARGGCAVVGFGRRGGGGGGGSSPRAGAHGLGDDLELVGAGLVVLLLVLHTVVVFEEELAGLLEDSAALRDRAGDSRGQRSRSDLHHLAA